MDSLAQGGCSSCALPRQEVALLPCAPLTCASVTPCHPSAVPKRETKKEEAKRITVA